MNKRVVVTSSRTFFIYLIDRGYISIKIQGPLTLFIAHLVSVGMFRHEETGSVSTCMFQV